MCFAPLAAIGMVVSMGQSMVSYMAAQQDYANKAQAWRQNYTAALVAGRHEQDQLTTRAIQENEAAAAKMHLQQVDEAKKVAEAQVSAAAGGVSGVSVANIVNDLKRSSAYNRVIIDANAKMTAAQIRQDQIASVDRIKSRINSMERPTAPNPLGFVLGAVGSALKYA